MIHTAWDPPVLMLQFEGVWSWQEFYHIYTPAVDERRVDPVPFYCVLDLLGSAPPPVGMLLHGERIYRSSPAHLKMWIVVGPGVIALGMMRLLTQRHPEASQRICSVDTVEDALRLLARHK